MESHNLQEASSSASAAQRLSRILASLSDAGGDKDQAAGSKATHMQAPPPSSVPSITKAGAASTERQHSRPSGNSGAVEEGSPVKYSAAAF
jgi:hypothetical protein